MDIASLSASIRNFFREGFSYNWLFYWSRPEPLGFGRVAVSWGRGLFQRRQLFGCQAGNFNNLNIWHTNPKQASRYIR